MNNKYFLQVKINGVWVDIESYFAPTLEQAIEYAKQDWGYLTNEWREKL